MDRRPRRRNERRRSGAAGALNGFRPRPGKLALAAHPVPSFASRWNTHRSLSTSADLSTPPRHARAQAPPEQRHDAPRSITSSRCPHRGRARRARLVDGRAAWSPAQALGPRARCWPLTHRCSRTARSRAARRVLSETRRSSGAPWKCAPCRSTGARSCSAHAVAREPRTASRLDGAGRGGLPAHPRRRSLIPRSSAARPESATTTVPTLPGVTTARSRSPRASRPTTWTARIPASMPAKLSLSFGIMPPSTTPRRIASLPSRTVSVAKREAGSRQSASTAGTSVTRHERVRAKRRPRRRWPPCRR